MFKVSRILGYGAKTAAPERRFTQTGVIFCSSVYLGCEGTFGGQGENCASMCLCLSVAMPSCSKSNPFLLKTPDAFVIATA